MTSIKFCYSTEPLTIVPMSDLHLDSPSNNEDKMMEDLETAKQLNAHIFLGGDIWSAVFPSDKKRYTSRHGIAQIDALLDYSIKRAFKILKPYANNIDLVCTGNHETSVIKYHHTDPTDTLRCKLNEVRSNKLPPIRHGGYTGFISLNFKPNTKSKCSTTEHWFFHHGKGGNSIVTRGAIDLQRLRASNFADVYWLGHKHTNISDIPKTRYVDIYGNIVSKDVLAFITAGYDGEVKEQKYEETGYILDWAEETFYESQSQGCAIIHYTITEHKGKLRIKKLFQKSVG